MPENPSKRGGDPLRALAMNLYCDLPDVKELSITQQCALHEFFHTVLAAGYKLQRVVPPKKAGPIIKKKFSLVLDDPDF